MTEPPLKVEIEWKHLEKIAEFYEFPIIVFLGNDGRFPPSKLTRNEIIRKKAELFDKLKDIFEELDLT